jgi:hypothetical protein
LLTHRFTYTAVTDVDVTLASGAAYSATLKAGDSLVRNPDGGLTLAFANGEIVDIYAPAMVSRRPRTVRELTPIGEEDGA